MKNSNSVIIDISWPITENMTAYKDRKTVAICATKTFEHDRVRENKITLGSHTGTHIDAPAHFIMNGKTIDQLPLENLCGPCRVVDMSSCEEKIYMPDILPLDVQEGERLLFKTRNSLQTHDAPFDFGFVYLDAEVAEFLAFKKTKLVGIDYLGIERQQPNHASHTWLFSQNVTIVEGLRLEHVQAGSYTLCCLPLSLPGLEAAPARAILLKNI
jgi:arylformamidase